MLTTPNPCARERRGEQKADPERDCNRPYASALEAATRTAMPAQKSPAAQRRTISALIGPGGQATDHPSTKPVARRAGREAVMCLHREAERGCQRAGPRKAGTPAKSGNCARG